MKHVTYISAGAGSGKTYTLTSILAHLIATGKAEPEQFILTTFTEKAAAEFKEKAKAKLYENSLGYGQYAQAAERLDQAMIGTIDSVAYTFVQKYWYLLNISPNLKIIDDDQKKFFISQLLSNIASKDETEFLVDFCSQFNISFDYASGKYGLNFDFWKDDVKTIFEKAKSYRINDFEESRKRSLAFVDEICGEWNLNYDRENILAFIDEVRNIATTQGMKNNIVLWDSIFSRKEKFHQLSSFYSEIASYADAKKGEKVKIRDLDLYQPVCDSLAHIYTSRQVKDYITRYVNLIFDYAQKCQQEFDEYKDKHHLIDFIDMETKFLELLKMPQVQEDIRSEYKYVFVDEFQDSSPIQVEIFDRLSEIVGSDTEDDLIIPVGEVGFHTHNSIWVGDFKQAIYGFRGADTELTKAVADIIAQKEKTSPKEYKIETLKASYRSLEDIVNFTNKVFESAFEGVLAPEQVRLEPIHKNKDQIQSLKFWSIAEANTEKRMKRLAAQIAARLKEGDAPGDYAVLARGNSILDVLSKALKELNIPVCRELKLGEGRDELTLVSALLKLVINNKDNYSRAVVAFLTQEGFTAGNIIDSKLEFNKAFTEAKENGTARPMYLPDNPDLKEFDANLSFYKAQTIHNLVESLITGLDLYSTAKCWESSQGSDEAFQAIIEASYTYEENCTQAGIAPTIYGFIDFAADNAVSAGSKDGVTLDTFHDSKGLEWKNVILLSLDKSDDDVKSFIKYDIFGVQNYHLNPPTEKDLYPPMIINLFPNLFPGNTNINGELQERIQNCSRYDSIHEHSDSEAVRLLYVAITRAKEQLILTTEGKQAFQQFNLLKCDVNSGISFEPDAESDLFQNRYKFKFENKAIEEGDGFAVNTEELVKLNINPVVQTEIRDVQPSSCRPSGEVKAERFFDSGKRIELNSGNEEMNRIGTCLHNIFCVLDKNPTTELAESVLKDYQMEKALPDAQSIVDAWLFLEKSLAGKFGEKTASYHELPFRQFYNGQIFTGSIDYIYETEKGVVLVDFKSYPGSSADVVNPAHEHYAGIYGGQFECYERALKEAGKKVLAKVVYYHVLGVGVELA